MPKDVSKAISKLNKVLHPKGRKTAQLTKKTIKAAGREKIKQQNQIRVNITGEKYLWFKENLEPVEIYTPELIIKLIEKYLSRFDDELEQIELKHSAGKRKGRQHASREDIIKMTIKNETNEFNTCGIEMPDILNPKQLILLKNWSGELRFLQNFKTVRYSRSKLENLKNSKKYTDTESDPKKKSENENCKESNLEKVVEKKEVKEEKSEEKEVKEKKSEEKDKKEENDKTERKEEREKNGENLESMEVD